MQKFIDLAFEWVNNSPHYTFKDIFWNEEDWYEEKTENQVFSLAISNDKKITAVRLTNVDNDKVLWTSDFTYEQGDEKNVIFVRLARDAMDKETRVSNHYNHPRLMKTILKNGYGADDNGLLISDQPIFFKDSDLQRAEGIICGKEKYLLPVVYVTKKFEDNKEILDVKELAKDLAGVAHVIVEENTEITSKLKSITDNCNPFNGAVHIYYTDKVGTRLLPDVSIDANNFRYRVVESVCRRLSLVKVDPKYSWWIIRYQKLQEQYKNDQKNSSDLIKTYEDLIKMQQEETKQNIEGLEEEINDLRAKVANYEFAFQNRKSEKSGNLALNCHEEEFYENEIKDLLIKLVKTEVDKMKEDPNQKETRKYHVLQCLLQENEINGKGKILEKDLKEILSRIDRLTAKDRKKLKELGFEEKDGKHNKLYFHGDERYFLTLAKTPSDKRSSKNAASIVKRLLIC